MMNKHHIFFYLILIFSLNSKGQAKSDTLRLLFGINEFQSDATNKRIDSLTTALNSVGTVVNVKIYGYADFLNSNQYNQSLSQKRADAAKNYFVKKVKPNQLTGIVCKALGEKFSKNNQTTAGEAFQRRVDIIIEPYTVQSVDYKKTEIAPTASPKNNQKKIEDLEKGESLAVEGLNFEPGRHYIVKEAVPILHKLLKTMQNKKSLKIQIQGHICCLIEDEDGMDLDTHEKKLSENRAKAIYDFLVEKGIDPNRLSYKGFGRSKPKISPETTPEEEQMNRRVEVMIIEK